MYQDHGLVPSGLELEVDVSTLSNVKGWKLYHRIVFPVNSKMEVNENLQLSEKCEVVVINVQ